MQHYFDCLALTVDLAAIAPNDVLFVVWPERNRMHSDLILNDFDTGLSDD